MGDLIPLISAAVQIGSAFYAKNVGSDASSDVARIQTGLLNEATNLQMEFLKINRADIMDAVEKGEIDLQDGFRLASEQIEKVAGTETLNKALDLIKNPEGIYESPDIQSQVGVGNEAVSKVFGGAADPQTAAIDEFSRNIAATKLTSTINRLLPKIQRETEGQNILANLNADQGVSLADLKVGGATRTANLTRAATPGITGSMENVGRVNLIDDINQSSLKTNLLQNVNDTGFQLAELFSKR